MSCCACVSKRVWRITQARRLCLNIDRIRSEYERSLKPADDPKRHQLATAIWIIDRLALRVGNEKDDDEADTVGCCSLRVEHMTFPTDGHVELNFLGKDSMPYHQVIGALMSPVFTPALCLCRPLPLSVSFQSCLGMVTRACKCSRIFAGFVTRRSVSAVMCVACSERVPIACNLLRLPLRRCSTSSTPPR